jgi:hypothetical protein
VPSKTKPLTGKALEAFEAERDLGAELLQSIREMKAGQGKVVYSEAIEARKKLGFRSLSLLRCWVCRYVRCKVGSKAASSPVVRPYIAGYCTPITGGCVGRGGKPLTLRLQIRNPIKRNPHRRMV